MLSLAALQSPLWRPPSGAAPISVRMGGATLVACDREIAGVTVSDEGSASAELVGSHEVLIRGKSEGTIHLLIASKDGHNSAYSVTVGPNASAAMTAQVLR